jgi:hypothetical protein
MVRNDGAHKLGIGSSLDRNIGGHIAMCDRLRDLRGQLVRSRPWVSQSG